MTKFLSLTFLLHILNIIFVFVSSTGVFCKSSDQQIGDHSKENLLKWTEMHLAKINHHDPTIIRGHWQNPVARVISSANSKLNHSLQNVTLIGMAVNHHQKQRGWLDGWTCKQDSLKNQKPQIQCHTRFAFRCTNVKLSPIVWFNFLQSNRAPPCSSCIYSTDIQALMLILLLFA